MYGDEPVTELGAAGGRVLRHGTRGAWLRLAGLGGWRSPPRSLLVASRRGVAVGRRGCATGSTTPACWAPLVFIALSALLTVAFFPGPLLAGGGGPAVRHRGRQPAQPIARRRSARSLGVLDLARRWATTRSSGSPAGASAPCARCVGAARRSSRSSTRRILPRRAVQPRQLRRRPDAIPLRAFAAATAIGSAPRAFAYAALGGSLDDLGSPEAIVAIVVLVGMAVGGARRAQTVWIWKRLVVPGRPLGSPAVMPTRSPRLDPAELDDARARVGDQLLGDLVAPHRRRPARPTSAPQRRTVSRPGESA